MDNRKLELFTGEQKKEKFGSNVFGAAQRRLMTLRGKEDGGGVKE